MLKKLFYSLSLLTVLILLAGAFLAGCQDPYDPYDLGRKPKETPTPEPTAEPTPEPTPEPISCIYVDQGFGAELTGHPDTIAVSPIDGNVYISEHHFEEMGGVWYNVSKIYKFDSSLELIDHLGTYEPVIDMDVAPNGNLVILENANHRIKIVSPADGTVIDYFDIGECCPLGIDVDGDGNIHVVGSLYYKKFLMDGTAVMRFDTMAGSRDVALDSATGTLVIVNYDDGQILRYGAEGELLGIYGSEGESPGELLRPTKVAVNEYGYIYVPDAEWRIQKFTSAGEYECGFYGYSTVFPIGVALDPINVGTLYTCNLIQSPGIGAKLLE